MSSPKMAKALAPVLAAAMLAWCATPVFAGDFAVIRSAEGQPTVDGGYIYNVWYDGRDDVRDFPTNGFFPGDFAADPWSAAIGAAGLFGSTPTSNYYYPPQGSSGDQTWCARRYRSYDPASGTYLGHDGMRRRCP
jgi:BA14K-like protein